MKRNAALSAMLIIFVAMMIALLVLMQEKNVEEYVENIEGVEENGETVIAERTLKIISSTENKELEFLVKEFADNNDVDIEIDYAGTLEIMDKINNGDKYDAVWASNSIWLYMLDENVNVTDMKSTNINPVIFAIKESKAYELNFVGRDIYTSEIVSAIELANIANGSGATS